MRIGSRQLGATIAFVAILQFGASGVALGQIAVASPFDPSGISSLCGLAFDSGAGASGEVWAYDCSGANVEQYSTAGTFLSSVPRAGESANDVDLELANQPFTLAATSIPARSLVFINGETGVWPTSKPWTARRVRSCRR